MTAAIKDAVIRAVAELPDRNSPKDRPEMMLVSSSELSMILDEALAQPAGEAEPLQEFESPMAKILMKSFQEGWTKCSDSEYTGEDAMNDAFNNSSTLGHCIAEDQLYTPQQSQPLTDEQIESLHGEWFDSNLKPEVIFHRGVRAAEYHHGIKKAAA